MAHELRPGYGFLAGEVIGGAEGLGDITDEVVAYEVGFLFSNKDAIKMVIDGKVTDWFKRTQLDTDLYRHLAGKEESLTINTPAAVYMNYYNNGRIAHGTRTSKNNTNMTVRDVVDILNSYNEKNPEFRYGDLLKR